jgi:hypothetical protein
VVYKNQQPQHLNIKCGDGFCNQLRMLLAGEFLMQQNLIQSCNMEWTLTNHNNVSFLDFYKKPKYINFKKLLPHEVNYTEGVFAAMTDNYILHNNQNWAFNLIKIFKTLKLKTKIQHLISDYHKKINCRNLVGVHIRRTCKTGVNKLFPERQKCLLTNQEYITAIKKSKLQAFVATDNKETQNYFKEQLNRQCIVYQDILEGTEDHNSYEYNKKTVKRFTEALHTIIDFYTLLNCKYFIGTEYSSFTSLVYYLRNNINDYKITCNV